MGEENHSRKQNLRTKNEWDRGIQPKSIRGYTDKGETNQKSKL